MKLNDNVRNSQKRDKIKFHLCIQGIGVVLVPIEFQNQVFHGTPFTETVMKTTWFLET